MTSRGRLLLGVLLAVALVLLGFLAYRASVDRYDPEGQSADRAARAAVVTRANVLAVQAMSYDSASAAADIAEAEKNMTIDMRVQYERTLPTSREQDDQDGTGAKIVARVVRSGLISLTRDKASVLVFVNQRASATSTKKVLESPTWQVLHLVRQDSQWLLSGMEAP